MDVRKAVYAIYMGIKDAQLKIGLPEIYIEDELGFEKVFSINDILTRKDMPGELKRAYFEFRQGQNYSLLSLSLVDGKLKRDNFLADDDERLSKVLECIDLESRCLG